MRRLTNILIVVISIDRLYNAFKLPDNFKSLMTQQWLARNRGINRDW